MPVPEIVQAYPPSPVGTQNWVVDPGHTRVGPVIVGQTGGTQQTGAWPVTTSTSQKSELASVDGVNVME